MGKELRREVKASSWPDPPRVNPGAFDRKRRWLRLCEHWAGLPAPFHLLGCFSELQAGKKERESLAGHLHLIIEVPQPVVSN